MGFGGVDQGLGTHYRGYYTTGAALRLAIPAANAGDVALVNDTDTWWIWDPDTADWVDSGNAGGGDFVGPEGGTSDGELVAFADTSGKLGKKSNILGGNVFFRDGTRALTADADAGSFRITNAATPQNAGDLTTKAYADALRGSVYGFSLPNGTSATAMPNAATALNTGVTYRAAVGSLWASGAVVAHVPTGGGGSWNKPVGFQGRGAANSQLNFTSNGGTAVLVGVPLFLRNIGSNKTMLQTAFILTEAGGGATECLVDLDGCVISASGGNAYLNFQHRVVGKTTILGGTITVGDATSFVLCDGNAAAFDTNGILDMTAVTVSLSGTGRLFKQDRAAVSYVFLRGGCVVPTGAFEAAAGATINVYYDDSCSIVATGAGAGTVNFIPAASSTTNKIIYAATGGTSNIDSSIDTINNGAQYVAGHLFASTTLVPTLPKTILKPLRITGAPSFGTILNMNANAAVYTMQGGELALERIGITMGNITNGGFVIPNGYDLDLLLTDCNITAELGPAPFQKSIRGTVYANIIGGTFTVGDDKKVFAATGQNAAGTPNIVMEAKGLTVVQSGVTKSGRLIALTYEKGRATVRLTQGCVIPANVFDAADGTQIDVWYDETCTVAEVGVTHSTGVVNFYQMKAGSGSGGRDNPMPGMVEGGALAWINTYSTFSYAVFNGGRVWDAASNSMVAFTGQTFGSAVSYNPSPGKTTVVAVNPETHTLVMKKNWEDRSETDRVLIPLWQMTFDNGGGFWAFTAALDARQSYLRKPLIFGEMLLQSEVSTGLANRRYFVRIDPDTSDLIFSADSGGVVEECFRYRYDLGGTLPTAFVLSSWTDLVLSGADKGLIMGTSGYVQIGANIVLGPQQTAIADPSGGSTVDAEARTVISSILTAMRTHGLIATT